MKVSDFEVQGTRDSYCSTCGCPITQEGTGQHKPWCHSVKTGRLKILGDCKTCRSPVLECSSRIWHQNVGKWEHINCFIPNFRKEVKRQLEDEILLEHNSRRIKRKRR